MNNNKSNSNNPSLVKRSNETMDPSKFNQKAIQFVRKSIDSDDFTLPEESDWPSFLRDKLKKKQIIKQN